MSIKLGISTLFLLTYKRQKNILLFENLYEYLTSHSKHVLSFSE